VLPVVLLLVFISLGTVISFSKIIKLLDPRSGPVEDKTKTISYVALSLPIVALVPLIALVSSVEEAYSLLGLRQIGESLIIICAGYLVYVAFRSRMLRLPQRIFRLEEAILVMLSMFFVTFFLVWLHF
jgi:hypothetical protein